MYVAMPDLEETIQWKSWSDNGRLLKKYQFFVDSTTSTAVQIMNNEIGCYNQFVLERRVVHTLSSLIHPTKN